MLRWFFRPKWTPICSCGDDLPTKITDEIGELISKLCSAEWKLLNAFYDQKVFGNWYVDLHRADTTIRLVKDRSQYQMTGLPRKELETAGLYTVFDDLAEFCLTVTKWAEDFEAIHTKPS